MGRIRVYELARELDQDSKTLLSQLQEMGYDIKTHQNTLTPKQIDQIRQLHAPEDKPKVVVRRRRSAPKQQASEGTQDSSSTERSLDSAPAPRENKAPQQEVAPQTPEVKASEPVVKPAEVKAEATSDMTVNAPAADSSIAVEKKEETPSSEVKAVNIVEPQARTEKVEAKVVVPAAKPAKEEKMSAAVVVRAAEPAPRASATVVARTPAQSQKQEPSEGAKLVARPARRSFSGGATIVRRATPEDIRSMAREREREREREQQQNQKTRRGPSGAPGSQDRRDNRDRDQSRDGRDRDQNRDQNRDQRSGPRPPRSGPPSSSPQSRPPRSGQSGGQGWSGGGQQNPASSSLQLPDPTLTKASRSEGRRGQPEYKTRSRDDEKVKAPVPAAPQQKRRVSTRDLLAVVDDNTDETVANPTTRRRTVYNPASGGKKRNNRRRPKGAPKMTSTVAPKAGSLVVKLERECISVAELARQMSIKAAEILKKLLLQGMTVTLNQDIDVETATLIASEYGYDVKSIQITEEDILKLDQFSDADKTVRPAIVTVMGHVDHGKTSILDAIRKADVAASEAGGITQHIGAYTVQTESGKKVAFLDTPGHAAFSSMRSRGARLTDVVILVVAADDGVMPQTIEAISHAKDAGVPIIVAVNKIDKPNINLDRIYTELSERGVQAEDWGGDIQFVKVSALQKTGLDELLEAVLLQAEMMELRARAEGEAEGVVVEARLDKGRGPVATVMVTAGQMKKGDWVVVGTQTGRVRGMTDHRGRTVGVAGPSTPVEVTGLNGVPQAGDQLHTVDDDKKAKDVADLRHQEAQARQVRSASSSLEELLAKTRSEQGAVLPVILKGDTQGSVEAIAEALQKLNQNPNVKVSVVHSAAGGINESDVSLAETSGAVIVGFNVRASRGIDDMIEDRGVVLQYFSVIYELVDTIKSLMAGKLPPVTSEVVQGHAEVRNAISVPKIGMIAGSAVLDGKITRNCHLRLIRDEVVIYDGKISSLRRFKDDVKEVQNGYECGIGIDGYNDIKIGDVLEAYVIEESAAVLEFQS